MATLVARPGDAQALKCLIGAGFGAVQLSLTPAPDAASVRAKASNPFGTNTVAYLPANGGAPLTEPNAIARLLGGAKLCPAAAAVTVAHWVQWEAEVLRPAVLMQGQPLVDALAQLSAALAGKTFLAGASATLADVAVYCCLLPIKASLSGTPAALTDAVASLPEVSAPTAAFDAGAMAGVHAEDAAALAASRPRLPIPGKRNILITSALPYVNNVPHLGNIIGCVLSADCYARYCRARGYNSLFVCGTDEYGTATETKALEEGLTPQQICDKYHAIHADIYQWFDIGFDKFGRTPSRAQTKICQSIFKSLEDQNVLVEQGMEQLYSEALGKFLADRYVVGTCPKCKYEDARGDQCDSCGALLNPTELIRPKCKFSGTTPVLRTTRHVFLDLPQLSPVLQEYITSTSKLGGWSQNCLSVTNAWMRDGLKNRCITRDLKWGTPVPRAGFEDKVFYVWFDAPIGYISITANYTPEWEAWWKNPKDVEMVQFMGKDNVPFHTVIFPATLLGTGEEWTMMRNISVTEYLNYEGGKFSKSRGTGVFGNDAKDTGIPAEVWRYYLLSNRPEQSDCDFKWSDLQARNNSELLANVGNFANRSLMFVGKFFDGKVPGATAGKGDEELAAFSNSVAPKVEEYLAAMEKIKIRDGIKIVMAISAEGNRFLQETAPWTVVKTDKDKCASLVTAAVGLVRLLAALMQPYMPALSAKLRAQLALPKSALDLTDELLQGANALHTLMSAGHVLGTPAPLVSAIPDELIEQLRERFGGSQEERAERAAAGAAAGAAGTAGAAAAAAGGGKGAGADKKSAGAAGAAGGDKKAAGEKKGGEKKAEPEGPPDVSRLDLRVGVITKAWRHPDAESLYVEEVDVGEGAPRQVVSGLVKYIPEAEMQGRRVVVLCNLKPANMRGVQSQAMVMAATSADGAIVELVEPPAGCAPGEPITFEGYASGVADVQLNPKKKVFEAVQPDLVVRDDLVAAYKGVAFTTTKGPCVVKSVKGAGIK
ncbi:hypothetical protein FOA52_001764 [Chlamydomonas sp. UWO 241]|nr:hypothetical protein FOA52_001764 [Chlamydomonas sp. UWO 241]